MTNKADIEKNDDLIVLVKELLRKNTTLGTQEEVVQALSHEGYEITQSSISRALRKLGAFKVISTSGKSIYQLPMEQPRTQVAALIVDILFNETCIVIHTTPGSASLIAGLLDREKPGNILGTLAGDDTLLVIPQSVKNLQKTVEALRVFLG